MIKNYRRIGATNASYISGLSSGKSQGGETASARIKETVIIKVGYTLKVNENIAPKINETIIIS